MGLTKWPIGLLICLLLIPVVGGTLSSLLPAFGYFPSLGRTEFTFQYLVDTWHHPAFFSMVGLTLSSGILSTLIAVLLVLGMLSTWSSSKRLSRIEKLCRPMLLIPHATAAIALGFILSPSGLVIRLISPEFTGFSLPPSWPFPNDRWGVAMIIALALKEMPFLLLLATSVFLQPQRKHDIVKQIKLAQTLGYSPFASFILVGWPQLYPLLRLPIFAVLIYSGSSIEIPLILGPSSPATLAVTMLTSFNDVDLNQRLLASAFAINQMLLSCVSVLIWLGVERIGRWARVFLSSPARSKSMLSPLKVVGVIASATSMLTVICALFGLVLLSFAGHWPFSSTLPTSFTLSHWTLALNNLFGPLETTLLIGLVVTVTSLILCVGVLETLSKSKRLYSLLTVVNYVPLLVPMVVFMFGASFLINELLGNETLIAVFLLHFVIVTPYMWIALSRQYLDFDERLITVARSLGRSEIQIFTTIKLPLMWSTFMVALALGISISFSQYLPTLLGGSGAVSTVTTEAVALASGGSRRITAVYGLVQIMLPTFVFMILTGKWQKWNRIRA